ncbi:hypothetical protein [Flavobacterium humi]|uniref:Uncharacterized protein n=1 Tax=Flavobacterium humi TaxID=2562683 RepID=A0A4Z0LC94_9FLAO|nr:hypothetical protein [Flavobacterium humi]TGD59510.1 hypothetical protein E4635_00825 [Flavobacterium humi]
MDTDLNHILIFATNIKTLSDKQKIAGLLDVNPAIQQWSIDQEDIDCVLRIVSPTLSVNQLIAIVNQYHFECKEL